MSGGWLAATTRRYRDYFAESGSVTTLVSSLVVFALAEYVNFWAINQATERASNAVADIILSNIPVIEVDGMFVYGTFACVLFTLSVVLPHPRRVAFVLRGLALFIVIRSAFTLLTHLGSPEAEYVVDFGEKITAAFYGADQFFSGHTGMPFLGALAFWQRPWIRNTFLAFSMFFAVVVLIGHIHYSIDVAAALFITYGIYHIARCLFAKDYARFRADLEVQ